MLAVLALWYRSQGFVAVDTVNTPKVKAFYWATITFSQTLGTALGDWMADDAGLGYEGAALVVIAALALVAAGYFWTKMSHVLLFWAAFILTRPLGATIGDFLDKPVDHGGLALSRPLASAVIAIVISPASWRSPRGRALIPAPKSNHRRGTAMLNSRLSLWLLCAICCSAGKADDKPLYTITKTVPIGAPDRWDLLTFDPDSHRVYIAHGDRVTVVDGQSGSVIGNIEGYSGGTHGVVIVPGSGRGYTDDGQAGVAASFDVNALRPLKTIKAQADADAIIFDPASGHVFVIDADPGKITVIDPRTETAIATLDGGGKLEIGAADGTGKIYINGEEKQEILRVDTRTNRIDARWPISSCTSPHGIAVDAASHRVFSSCENNLMVVIDADDGKQIATLPIGARTDGAAFDPHTRRAFSSNGDGTLTVIAENTPNSFVVLGNVPTTLGARTMTLDPKTGRLYLVAADMKVNEGVDPKDARHRFSVVPGTAKLLFLDPAPVAHN